jgi:tetratricopeptide (TPR) repeat protein
MIMSNKKTIKNVLILLIAILVIGAVYWFSDQKGEEVQKKDLIASMTEFKALDKDLDPDSVDRYYEDFTVNKNFFLENLANPALAFQSLNKMALYKKLVADYWGAEEIWLYTADLEPNSYLINGNLANIYHYSLPDYPKAETYYLKALGVENIASGNHYTYFSDLYTLYRFQMDDQVKTIAILERGMSELPEDINIVLLTAKYYKDTDNTEQARYYYNEALKINPNSVVAKDGLKNL